MRKIVVSNYMSLDGFLAGPGGEIDRIFVNPVLLGKGKPEFPGLKDMVKLELLEAKAFRSGVVLLRYRPGLTK